jgi:small subunit ribosomal protein S8
MQITDTIADFLTRIRNAGTAKHELTKIPASNVKKALARVLFEEGYIKKFSVASDNKQGIIKIFLKYDGDKSHVIKGLRRISKPSLRVYSKADKLPRVMRGLGVALISTSKGVMADRKARNLKLGGEVLAYVW